MMLLEDYIEAINTMLDEGSTIEDLDNFTESRVNDYRRELSHVLDKQYDYWKATHNVHRPTLAELLLTIPLEQHIYIETPDEKVVYSGAHKNLSFEIRKQYCAKLVISQSYIEKAVTIYIEE